jgi:CxxC-x17-CxxC domain-containing protein
MLREENFQEITLQCADCSQDFIFTPEEQEFYQQKGYSQPKRCAACRSQNRQNKSGGKSFGVQKPRFEAICNNCGINTTVPFEPTQGKPVYCIDCYKAMK